MRPRSVTDLLAEQPEEALLAMREDVQKELSRLTLEAQQIDAALAKLSRKNRGGRRPRGGSDRLTREQVFEAVEQAQTPVTPTEVHEALLAQGLNATPNAVRNHLIRLVDQNGWLMRTDGGRFAVSFDKLLESVSETPTSTQTSTQTVDDEIPF
jgi:response regulator of citrate/malate metabolism